MLKIEVIKLNTISNPRKSNIQTLHTDLRCSTTPSTFKSISAGLTKCINETKMKKRTATARTLICLFLLCLGFSCPDHVSDTQMGVMLITKFGCALGAIVVFFCRLCTNPSSYKLGRRKNRSTLDSSLIFKNSRRSLEKRFFLSNPRFCNCFCSRVIHMFIGEFSI